MTDDPGHPLWPHLDNWAAEIGLSGADAVSRACLALSTGPGQGSGCSL